MKRYILTTGLNVDTPNNKKGPHIRQAPFLANPDHWIGVSPENKLTLMSGFHNPYCLS